MDVATLLTSVLSSGATATACTWFAKRAVDHAFAKNLADARAAFDLSLEDKKQAFQRDLEAFKAQLTLAAEVRRHAAAEKVRALLSVASSLNSAVEKTYTAQPDQIAAGQSAIGDFGSALRAGLVLFAPQTVDEMRAFHAELARAHAAQLVNAHGGQPVDVADLLNKGEAARNKLLDAIRRELQLEIHTQEQGR